MKQNILFIHGGGGYEADGKLAASLQNVLGSDYYVQYPLMPNEDAPEYGAWKARIEQELTALGDKVILVGHSLGGSMVLKQFAESQHKEQIAALFLIAAPYWSAEDWQVEEYALPADFAAQIPKDLPIYLYHSRDDEWVPFDHMALYKSKLPGAIVREFDGRGHQFNDDLSAVAADITRL
ncbi:MAG: alpha/beta fold hydrolase [Anaerolineae bacterium]|nr:alpha/beta fold hydrolase [Anaerolineae bacterium]